MLDLISHPVISLEVEIDNLRLMPEVQDRLFPHLELVPLPLRAVLYESRRPMRHVYFPTDSIISLQYLLENGTSTALSVVGNEGLLGISFLWGARARRAGRWFRAPVTPIDSPENR